MRFSTVLTVVVGWHSLLCQPIVHADIHSLLRRISETPAQTPHPAIARVQVAEPGAVSQGSGSLIGADDTYGWVITNWHVVRGASGDITVSFPGGYQSPAVVSRTDEDWDLALLAIHRPPLEPLPMAAQVPVPGETLFIAGYGQGKFRLAQGACLGYAAPDSGFPEEMIDVSVPARQGDSGGPIVNAQGQLVGVLFGSGRGTTTGTHIGRLRQFLAEVSAPDPKSSPTNSPQMIAGQPMTSHRAPSHPPVSEQPGTEEESAPEIGEERTASLPPVTRGDPGDVAPPPAEVEAITSSGSLVTSMPANDIVLPEIDEILYGANHPRARSKTVWTETQGFLAFIAVVAVLLLMSPKRST